MDERAHRNGAGKPALAAQRHARRRRTGGGAGALAHCALCQADLAGLRRLREAGAAAAAAVRPGTRAGALAAPDRAALRRACSGGAANDPRWLRRAAFFQCGVIVLLGALLARPGATLDAYRALGAAPDAQAQAVVVFRPDTAERELRRIVRASGARIVGGPTVTDAYVLAMPEASAASLARLRAEPAVLLAEPLAAGEGR